MAEQTPVAAATAGGDTAVVDKTLLTTETDDAAGTGNAEANAAGTPSWRDDWREAFAGEDDAALRHLKRFTSPENFHKSYRDLQKKLTAGQSISALPEGATPDEIAAYRKAAGIPDAPDGYGFALPAELKPTEADAAVVGEFQAWMHERNVPPSAARAAFEFYTKRIADTRAAMADAVQEANIAGMAELRAEWKGKEFTRNMALALENVETALGEKTGDLANLQLANGQKLGDHPLFLRYAVHNGRANADDEALIGGDGAGGGKSIDDEYKELIAESVKDPKAWAKNTGKQTRLNELAAAKVNRQERASRRAA